MIIAQITDLHIGFYGQGNFGKNADRLAKVVKAITGLRQQPDLMIATGDLVENGEVWAYKNVKEALSEISCPIYMAIGNHDKREPFRKVFPEAEFNDGFLQYTIEDYPVRIIVLDTMEEGRHGGSFCVRRAKWLEAELSKQPDRPTLIALHHPPIDTGIGWMTSDPNSDWVKRLHDVISKYDNVVHIIAGHIHRTIFRKFAGTSLSVSQAIAPHVKLELAEINVDEPDGRGLIVEGRPGFCLHQWDRGAITTHSAQAPCGKTLLKFSKKFSHVVKQTLDWDD
jgi:3',5'-cyclic AMP phosphodiesterase CpdA